MRVDWIFIDCMFLSVFNPKKKRKKRIKGCKSEYSVVQKRGTFEFLFIWIELNSEHRKEKNRNRVYLCTTTVMGKKGWILMEIPFNLTKYYTTNTVFLFRFFSFLLWGLKSPFSSLFVWVVNFVVLLFDVNGLQFLCVGCYFS